MEIKERSTLRPSRLEIDLAKVRHNIDVVIGKLEAGTKMLAVVKANAYGMGSVPIGREVLKKGAAGLAVALPEEGVKLRAAGITAPIYLLGLTRPASFPLIAAYNLIPAICESTDLETLAQVCLEQNKTVEVMIAVDTGMHRIGVAPAEVETFVREVQKYEPIQIKGFFSHMADAEAEEDQGAREQIEAFRQAMRPFGLSQESGVSAGEESGSEKVEAEGYVFSMANSAGTMRLPESHFNAARPGVVFCGIDPCAYEGTDRLIPICRWISEVVHVQQVKAGDKIGYGGTYECKELTQVATIPLGYADGYPRELSNKGAVLIGGVRCPVVGRVCMDQFMVKVPAAVKAAPGDEVVLLGSQGAEHITAEEVARQTGSIPHELLCRISERIPRVYLNE